MALTARKLQFGWLTHIRRYQGLIGLFLLLAVAFFLDRTHFYSATNLANILNQLAVPGLLAVGMTFVILTGGIDLSVGSLLGLINCIVATWIVSGTGIGLTVAYAVLVGIGVGALLGLIVDKSRLQPFVVTLAAMVSLRGIAYVYTNNGTVSGLGDKLAFLIEPVFGIPVSAYIMLAMTLIAAWVLWGTLFGRHIYAVGGNDLAARYAGLNLTMIRMGAYAANGFCVAVAALVYTARNTNGDPSAGLSFELDAITAVVIGGTSLLGGIGGAVGTFLGALFIVCLDVLLILKGVNTQVGWGWKGLIILIAVYLQNIGRRI
jgi:ribose/xylose/arabinose/galactoside ABC-type transport system permease subunit